MCIVGSELNPGNTAQETNRTHVILYVRNVFVEADHTTSIRRNPLKLRVNKVVCGTQYDCSPNTCHGITL